MDMANFIYKEICFMRIDVDDNTLQTVGWNWYEEYWSKFTPTYHNEHKYLK